MKPILAAVLCLTLCCGPSSTPSPQPPPLSCDAGGALATPADAGRGFPYECESIVGTSVEGWPNRCCENELDKQVCVHNGGQNYLCSQTQLPGVFLWLTDGTCP